MLNKVTCSLVVPCYNEQDAIPCFLKTMDDFFLSLPDVDFSLIFVDDGSKDNSLNILRTRQAHDSRITILELSRNFGKEAALTAGLAHAKGDIVIPMDVDLQDPPTIIPEMIKKWRDGFDVVLAQRESRNQDSFLKKNTAKYFYKIINRISPINIPYNVGDFRLMDKAVVRAINTLPESCRFMKGLFSYVGFRTTIIKYERPGRSVGKSKFNFISLLNFAIDGITSFSMMPLRVWGLIGLGISLISIFISFFFLLRTIFFGTDVPGYASIIVSCTFLGGLQLLGIGIVGEYLGRVYMETKNRPIYFIRKIYSHKMETGENPPDNRSE